METDALEKILDGQYHSALNSKARAELDALQARIAELEALTWSFVKDDMPNEQAAGVAIEVIENQNFQLAIQETRIMALEVALQKYADPDNWRRNSDDDLLTFWHGSDEGPDIAKAALTDGDE